MDSCVIQEDEKSGEIWITKWSHLSKQKFLANYTIYHTLDEIVESKQFNGLIKKYEENMKIKYLGFNKYEQLLLNVVFEVYKDKYAKKEIKNDIKNNASKLIENQRRI